MVRIRPAALTNNPWISEAQMNAELFLIHESSSARSFSGSSQVNATFNTWLARWPRWARDCGKTSGRVTHLVNSDSHSFHLVPSARWSHSPWGLAALSNNSSHQGTMSTTVEASRSQTWKKTPIILDLHLPLILPQKSQISHHGFLRHQQEAQPLTGALLITLMASSSCSAWRPCVLGFTVWTLTSMPLHAFCS